MRLVHAANLMLLAALLGLSLYIYPELPDRIPLHFGADGTPDRWGNRALHSWMALPVIGSASVLMLYAIGWLLPARPNWLNMPDRKKLLALPPEHQRPVLQSAGNMLYILALQMLIMFCAMQYGAWESAHTGMGSDTLMAGVIFGLVSTPFVTIALFVVVQRRMDAAWRAFQAERP
jgi:uncharacterized membrane protein